MKLEKLLSEGIQATPPSFVRGILAAASRPDIISFAGGLPNPISFPREALSESMQRVTKDYGDKAFQYAVTAGLPELREYIANRYNRRYGLRYTEDNVLITTGSQQGLDLMAKILLDKGDNVIVERPTYLAAIQAFSMHQPVFRAVELTEDGLDTAQLSEALKPGAKLMYTVPDFQNPTGLTYSAENREDVFRALDGEELVLIEDDPYGDLRFEDEHQPYIGAGRLPCSVLFGTFSKTVTPGMRTGFILSENTELLWNLSKAKEASDLHTNIFSQYVIWDYLMHNDLEKHIGKITALYRSQAKSMLDAMDEFFPEGVTYTRPRGGMFLWVRLPEGISANALLPKAMEKKVAFVPGDPFYVDEKDVPAMRLNYTNADSETIREGIRRLGEVLEEAVSTNC